jgi:type VI secretion system secreted protein VgrG
VDLIGDPLRRESNPSAYAQKYIQAPGFDQLAPSPLQTQLIDFGVNSGPAIAIQKLQEILGVATDGQLGPETLAALRTQELRVVNNKLVASRLRMIASLAAKRPNQVQSLQGWVNRALEFLIP